MTHAKPAPSSAGSPPISTSAGTQPQDALLQRGVFDAPSTPGTLGRLDRFEILRLLGEGGMGQVYLAREPLTETLVAIKVMKPPLAGDPQLVHRFLTEARHMYQLSHPHILRVLEVSDRKEGPYYVMPYLAGGSLLACNQPGQPMPPERVLTILRQVAQALTHAHAQGLIHRDLKPGNVLLDKDGHAFLTDFGLVRTVFNDSIVDASASHLEGTAPYMSPAVARGGAEDTRCDIYAFGALLYELLAGRPPYSGRSPQMILDQIITGPPPPIPELNPKASAALVRIAEVCMARELRDRYASMTDVLADLDRIARGAPPLGALQQRRRMRSPGIALAGAGLLVLAAIGVATHRRHESTAATPVGTHTPPAAPDPFLCTTNYRTITITKYMGPGGDVTIPPTINGLPVTAIGRRAFAECAALTSVTIPDCVTRIDEAAFLACNGLTRVRLPTSLTFLGTWAFASCEELIEVTVPAGVTTMGQAPFMGGAALTAITVDPANPAFSSADGVLFSKDMTQLINFPAAKSERNFGVPDSVTSIGASAFRSCHRLTTITFPAGLTVIRSTAFRRCRNLTSLYFKGNAPSLGDGVLFDDDRTTVYYPASATGWGATFAGRPTAPWDPIGTGPQ
jgi:hypothetical protein